MTLVHVRVCVTDDECDSGVIPAVILASISTLESAGIHSSGSSTRSWIGILCGICVRDAGSGDTAYGVLSLLTLGQRWRRASYWKGGVSNYRGS